MVIDLYTASAFREHICVPRHFPHWRWPGVRVVPWLHQRELLEQAGQKGFVEEVAPRFIGRAGMDAPNYTEHASRYARESGNVRLPRDGELVAV